MFSFEVMRRMVDGKQIQYLSLILSSLWQVSNIPYVRRIDFPRIMGKELDGRMAEYLCLKTMSRQDDLGLNY